MKHEDRAQRAKARRKPVKPRVASRPELRGSLDRVVARIDARHGDNAFGAALRAGNLVRQIRKEAGLSQRALGKALGISQARISEIEAGAGAQGPTWALMERILAACGRTLGIVPVARAAERQKAFVPILSEDMSAGNAAQLATTKPEGADEAIKAVKAHAAAKFDEALEIALNLGIDHRAGRVIGAPTRIVAARDEVRVAGYAKGDKAREATEVGAVKAAKRGLVKFGVGKTGIYPSIGKRSLSAADLRRNFDAFVEAVLKAKPVSTVKVGKPKAVKSRHRSHGDAKTAIS